MKTVLISFISIITFIWAWELFSPDHLSAGSLPWAIYREGLNLTGLLAILLMSLTMLLATRPAWLERPLGGLDRIYRLHKWSGILAGSFAVLHWLVEMSDDPIKALFGRWGRSRKDGFSAFPEPIRDFAEDLGEWAFYILLMMLVLALWKYFSYKRWRPLHRVMPLLYLLLTFHAVVLAPASYWTQPIGLLLTLLILAGITASILSLTGRIGQGRRVSGEVISVSSSADIVEVGCRLNEEWHGNRPGQFALVTFDTKEGHHPFTIASAERSDRTITFAIKALGDYTRTLPKQLSVGSSVQVEGPYGCFQLGRVDPYAQQIWIAGGIGITPFLAWLESLQGEGAAVSSDLHYCMDDRTSDPFVSRLKALCKALPKVNLHLHDRQSGRLDTEALILGQDATNRMEVWFCGPKGLGESLNHSLKKNWLGNFCFHQEAFEMR
jgi:predicted ferric reductase